MIGRTGRYSVYSIRIGEEVPFLEATFFTQEEAETYAEGWNKIQSNYEYWIVDTRRN